MVKKNVHPIIRGAGWIGSFAGTLIEELDELGVSFDEIHNLGKPTEDGRVLVRVCAEKIAEMVKGLSEFLKLISGNEHLVIDPTDGKEVLAEANDLFAYVDPDFRNWNTDEPGQATSKISVRVYELVKDSTFSQMFGFLSSDIGGLCLSQDQIKGFVRKYRQWLRTDGYATFFLFKSHGHFFVADVHLHSDGRLKVGVLRFEHSHVWHAGRRRRVVVPQLA